VNTTYHQEINSQFQMNGLAEFQNIEVKVQVQFTLEQATKARGGVEV
jgi:hypothetical protein